MVDSSLAMSAPPSIQLHIPGMLRDCCGGASELDIVAPTVGAVLELLERQYPALHRRICHETGAVRRHVNLFVNADHIRDLAGLDTALRPGDVVSVMPAVSGG
jgi:MoaD family protein